MNIQKKKECVVNEKLIDCLFSTKPENSIYLKQKVTVKWNDGKWDNIPICEWECKAGYHEKDNSCILDGECLVNTCSEHGSCSIVDYRIKCNCNEGYQGSNCENCENDYQDSDNNGIADVDAAVWLDSTETGNLAMYAAIAMISTGIRDAADDDQALYSFIYNDDVTTIAGYNDSTEKPLDTNALSAILDLAGIVYQEVA